MKLVFKLIAIFIIGIVGGIFADQILWPYFIEKPLFYEYGLEQTPMYVTEVKEITIEENTALQDIVGQVKNTIVGIRTNTKEVNVFSGSGLITTSDGLMVTLANVLPKGAAPTFFLNEKWPAYQILKRDLKNNLALVKLEESNLATVNFADSKKIKLGERVFLIGTVLENGVVKKIINDGTIRSISEDLIETNIIEENFLQGSPLFNIQGEVIGLSIINSNGKVSTIPVSKIRDFLGF